MHYDATIDLGIYLDGLWFPTLNGSEVIFRRSGDDAVLPAERKPIPGEPRRLRKRQKRDRGSTVVGHVDGDLFRRVVECHRGERGGGNARRRLPQRVGGADEDVDGGEVIGGNRVEEAVGELAAPDGAPPEGLVGDPHEGK